MSKIRIFSLGGLNESGKNMYVVEVDNNIFVFDAGLKYADRKLLGVDYIVPNIDYLKENEKRIKGIFLTHGHDGAIGAIANLVSDLQNVRVYATKFTIQLVKEELEENGIEFKNLFEITPHRKLNFKEVSVFPIRVTHSIPDAVGYVLNTPDGSIVYTGNFVFDATMMGAYKTDIGKVAYVGKQGVLCLMSESVYAEKMGHTSPNHRVSSLIKEILVRNEDRIIFSLLSANIARFQELFNEISKTDRKVIIMGKKLQKLINDVIDQGYITFDKERIGALSNINDKDAVILISNERERPYGNIERIVNGYDKYIILKESDTVAFLELPDSNSERLLVTLADEIARIGANVVLLSSKKNLSYHASSEDLMLMINLLNPKYYFPVIGEYRHQVANAKVANKVGIENKNILLKENGDVVEFVNGELTECFDKVKVGDVLVDGNSSQDVGELVLKDRQMLSDNGIVIISATLDKKTKEILAGPEVLTRGFIYVKESADMINEIQNISINVINENIENGYVDFNKIKTGIRDNLGKYLYSETECKPMIITVVQEI